MSTSCLRDRDVFSLLEASAGGDLEPLRAHLDACFACQELMALASAREEAVVRDGDTILDRYRVLGELGRGGMGVVYRVHDPKLHRDLAVKLLHSADASAPLRLEREAQALARLSHPNIVTVFDIVGVRDRVCMVMELVDGESLRSWLSRAPARGDVLRVFRSAAEGLHAAHRAGLVHRDFKPENVLVVGDGRVKIVDFGLAAADVVPGAGGPLAAASLARSSALHRLTRTGQVVGTPAYMAPEQLRGVEADARSDQFSFAVCLWEALCGERPFDAATIDELRRNIERGPASSPEARRDGVMAALRRALSTDPQARFASMEDLARALEGAEPDRARSRAAIVAGAVVLAVAALGAAASTTLARRAPDGVAAHVAVQSAPPVATPPAPGRASAAASAADAEPTPTSLSSALHAPAPSVLGPRPTAARRSSGATSKDPPARVEAAPLAATSTAARGPNGAPLID